VVAGDIAKAKVRNSAAVMLITQADPGFDGTDATRGPVRDPRTLVETDKLRPVTPLPPALLLTASRFPGCAAPEVIAFEKPVAYVHGDSHYFRVDKPFLDAKAGGSRTSRASRRSATTCLARTGQR